MLPEVDLSPKGIGAILDDAVAMFRANARTFAVASLLVVLPFALIMSIASVWYARSIFELVSTAVDAGSPDALFSGNQLASTQATSGVASAAMPLYYLARWFLMAAVVTAGPAILYGVRVEPGTLLKPGWRAAATFIGAQVLVVVALYALMIPALIAAVVIPILGVLGAVAGMLFLTVRLSIVAQTAVAENRSIPEAFKRSWALTRRRFWRTVGFYVSLGLVTYAVSVAIQTPTMIHAVVSAIQSPGAVFEPVSVGWKVLEGLLAGIATAIVVPYTALAWYRYYLDLRSRSEGMDLIVRAHALTEDASS